MIRVKFYMSDLHACGHVRGEAIARQVNKMDAGVVMDCKADMLYSDMLAADVMVFQRHFTDTALAKMEHAKKLGIKVIYETDDDVLKTPKNFWRAHSHYKNPEVQEMIKRFLHDADAVTASTKELALSLNDHTNGNPIYIVENALDVERWEEAYTKRRQPDGMVVLGWMASESHTLDAPLISNALKRIMREYDNVFLHSIGWVNDEQFQWTHQFHDRVKLEEWVNINELPWHMNDIDIGVAPLVDNPFNKAKSGLKALQYWAMAAPCVATPLPCYTRLIEDKTDGLFAKTPDEWYDALRVLVENQQLRIKMGLNGRRKLMAEHTTKRNAKKWIEVFKKVAGE